MKASELRKLSVEDLKSKERDLAQELFNVKFQLHTGRLEDSGKISQLRRDIARVKTLIREDRS